MAHSSTKNKIFLTGNQLKYYYFTQVEQYMELEYVFKGKIKLDEKEEQIFEILKDVLKVNNLNTTMRVAGGWVRDKVRFDSPNLDFLQGF